MSFYTGLLGTETEVSDLPFPEGRQLTEDEGLELMRRPSEEDIRKAVFSI